MSPSLKIHVILNFFLERIRKTMDKGESAGYFLSILLYFCTLCTVVEGENRTPSPHPNPPKRKNTQLHDSLHR